MANIPAEKQGSNWWAWLLGLLILAGLIWILVEAFDTEEVPVADDVEAITPETTPEPVAVAPTITISDILGSPTEYIGEPFSPDQVNVVEVPTDRGFWIEDNGERLFVVIIDVPQEEPKDINPGQMVQIEEGVLRDRTFLPDIPGAPLDPDTESIAQQQPIFLTVDESNITILEGGTPQPGTDPAETIE